MRVSSSVGLARTLGLLLLTGGSAALAQDFEIEEAPAIVANAFDLHESNFDRWVFGNVMNAPAGKAFAARAHLEGLLALSVGEVDRSCSLTEAQKKQLSLAGRGDIKHFLDRLAEARKVFDQLRHDQNNINAIYQETIPLAKSIQNGLFGTDSIFAKSILSTLETDQAERYRTFLEERNRFRHEAKVRIAIVNLDQVVGMTFDQRRQLIDLILKETKPNERPINQYENQVVLVKVSRIPEAKIRAILDEPRWKTLKQQLQQARAMEAFLKQNGFLDESDGEVTTKPAQIKRVGGIDVR